MNYRALAKMIKVDTSNSGYVTLPEHLFRHLLRAALRHKGIFDEQIYLRTNPDVKEALKKREFKSALDHYLQSGYFENRVPTKIKVD